MKAIHIVGRKNHGKTTLITELIQEMVARGLQVGSMKHGHRDHQLDTPGKDSTRHREAGAAVVVVTTPHLTALYQKRDEETNVYEEVRQSFGRCDIVLIEGNINGPGPKVEVWREAVGTNPLATERDDIRFVVTDDPIGPDAPVLSRQDVTGLVDALLQHAETI